MEDRSQLMVQPTRKLKERTAKTPRLWGFCRFIHLFKLQAFSLFTSERLIAVLHQWTFKVTLVISLCQKKKQFPLPHLVWSSLKDWWFYLLVKTCDPNSPEAVHEPSSLLVLILYILVSRADRWPDTSRHVLINKYRAVKSNIFSSLPSHLSVNNCRLLFGTLLAWSRCKVRPLKQLLRGGEIVARARQWTGVSITGLSHILGDRGVSSSLLNLTPCRQMVLRGPVSLLRTIAHEHTHGSSVNTLTKPATQMYTLALRLEKSGALGYLQSRWCLTTLSVASSDDWQRLNEYFLSLNSIIKSLAVPGKERMFTFTLRWSYTDWELFLQVSKKLLQAKCWLRYSPQSAASFYRAWSDSSEKTLRMF